VAIVHVGQNIAYARTKSLELGNPFPILLDADSAVINQYMQLGAEAVLFPLGYLMDREGVLRHIYNAPDPDGEGPPTLEADLEALVGDGPGQ
jgi:peroxiredoxin